MALVVKQGMNSGEANGSYSLGLTLLESVDDLLLLTEEHRSQILTYLLSQVRVGESCWEWQGTTLGGYPRTSGGLGHRLMYVLFYKQQIGSYQVCHSCDNPICINPAHLFMGTHQDNVDDQVQKQRHCFGSKNGRAILTEDLVYSIRCDYFVTFLTQKKIATKYGLTTGLVQAAVQGKKWTHVAWPSGCGPRQYTKHGSTSRRAILKKTESARFCGEASPRSKLTNEQALEIRRRFSPSPNNKGLLAAEFGVSVQLIQRIVHNRSYKITPPDEEQQ